LGHRYICPLLVEVRAWALDDSFNTTHNVENETKAALILAYLEQLTLLKLKKTSLLPVRESVSLMKFHARAHARAHGKTNQVLGDP
jgi:hypothetical protein